MEATISEPGGAEPAAEPRVMVLQRKQLSTANRATDPIQLQSVFKRTIEFKWIGPPCPQWPWRDGMEKVRPKMAPGPTVGYF